MEVSASYNENKHKSIFEKETIRKRRQWTDEDHQLQAKEFSCLMEEVLNLKVKDFVKWWCIGQESKFNLLLQMCGYSIEAKEGPQKHEALFQAYEWLKSCESRRGCCGLTLDLWQKIEALMQNRLSRRAFMSPSLFKDIQRFKRNPKDMIQRQIDYTLFNLERKDHYLRFDAKVTSGSEGKYVLRAAFVVDAMREEAVVEAGWEILDETFSIPSMVSGESYHFEERGSGLIIGGAAPGGVKLDVMLNIRNFLVQMFKGKSSIRASDLKGRRMCAIGAYVNNRFNAMHGVLPNTLEYYVVKEKLHQQFPQLKNEDQVLLERHLHETLQDSLIALILNWFPRVMENFLQVSDAYVSDSNSFDKSPCQAYSFYFTRNYSRSLHVDTDAVTWTVLLVWNPEQKERHFIIRSHKIAVPLGHCDLIFFRGDLLHGTEYQPLTNAKFSMSDIIIVGMTVNSATGKVLQSMKLL